MVGCHFQTSKPIYFPQKHGFGNHCTKNNSAFLSHAMMLIDIWTYTSPRSFHYKCNKSTTTLLTSSNSNLLSPACSKVYFTNKLITVPIYLIKLKKKKTNSQHIPTARTTTTVHHSPAPLAISSRLTIAINTTLC